MIEGRIKCVWVCFINTIVYVEICDGILYFKIEKKVRRLPNISEKFSSAAAVFFFRKLENTGEMLFFENGCAYAHNVYSFIERAKEYLIIIMNFINKITSAENEQLRRNLQWLRISFRIEEDHTHSKKSWKKFQ